MTIPAGTQVLGIVTGPVQQYYDAPVVVSAVSPMGGTVSVSSSITHSFTVSFGVNYSPSEIEGLQFTASISWTDATSSTNINTVPCTNSNCSMTFAAKMG